MLIAAMILGLIGGVSYFIGGTGLTVSDVDFMPWDDTPWWVISMIPIGIVGTIGAMSVLWKQSLAAVLLLMAGASAIAIGIVAYDDVPEMMPYIYLGMPMHPFGGSLFYSAVPLFSLIIAAALTIAGRKREVHQGN